MKPCCLSPAATRRLLVGAAPALLLSAGAAHAQPASQCLMEPAMRIQLKSAVSAQIVSVLADRGAVVRKGQPLVLLDAGVERALLAAARFRAQTPAQIKAAEARLGNWQTRLKRRDELQQQSYVSAQDRDDAAAEVRAAEADLMLAKDNRELARFDADRLAAEVGRRQLVSPIDGVVTERLQHPGDVAQAGETALAILKLAQIDPVRVEIVLPAARRGSVKVGDVVTVRPEAPFGGSYKATVKVVDPVIDSASGTFGLRLELPNPKLELPVGVKCTAELPGATAAAKAPAGLQ